jgi:hypothetical protein
VFITFWTSSGFEKSQLHQRPDGYYFEVEEDACTLAIHSGG